MSWDVREEFSVPGSKWSLLVESRVYDDSGCIYVKNTEDDGLTCPIPLESKEEAFLWGEFFLRLRSLRLKRVRESLLGKVKENE